MKLPKLRRKIKLTVVYTSGAKVHVKCTRFKISRSLTGNTSVEWEGLKPGALLLGVDDLAAVWEGWL